MYFLMIKKALETNMFYLCQTKKKDPYKYSGSGKYWLKHLEKHNPTVVTSIIGEYETVEELRSAGIYWSEYYDVVNSENWANLTREEGTGGWINDQTGKTWKVKNSEKMGKHQNQWIHDDGQRRAQQSERMKRNNPSHLYPRTPAQTAVSKRFAPIGCEASKKKVRVVFPDNTQKIFESKIEVTRYFNITYTVLNHRIAKNTDYNGAYFYEIPKWQI